MRSFCFEIIYGILLIVQKGHSTPDGQRVALNVRPLQPKRFFLAKPAVQTEGAEYAGAWFYDYTHQNIDLIGKQSLFLFRFSVRGDFDTLSKMITYYLGEEPVLHNAPTYLPFYEEDRKYVLDHLETLVVKDVAEAGGYGVVFGRDLTKQQLEDFRTTIRNEPRRFIAQEVIDFLDLPIMEGGEKVPRKADLRAFVLSSGDDTKVWASGLTRFSRNPDSFVVNSSQGGGFKDTWVLSR